MKPRDYANRLEVFARQHAKAREVRNEAPTPQIDGPVATMRLYDVIDSWGEFYGISAREFARTIDELPPTVAEIRLHVNSVGGEVWEGLAILNTLRSHRARVVAIVDGIAASAASFIAVGVDETIMAPNSELMIHDAWGLCVGNAADMRSMAELLDKESDNIAAIYARKAGGDIATWRTAMADEAWYSAEEAVAAGLADSVDQNETVDAEPPAASFDLSIFNYAGRTEAPTPNTTAQAPADRIDVTNDVTEFLTLLASAR